MKHSRSCKKYHWLVRFKQSLVVGSHVTEVKHVALNESFLYFFIGPVNEELVVEICLLSKSTAEVDWVLKTGSVPVGLKQDAQLLSASKCKHWNQNFAALVKCLVHLP